MIFKQTFPFLLAVALKPFADALPLEELGLADCPRSQIYCRWGYLQCEGNRLMCTVPQITDMVVGSCVICNGHWVPSGGPVSAPAISPPANPRHDDPPKDDDSSDDD